MACQEPRPVRVSVPRRGRSGRHARAEGGGRKMASNRTGTRPAAAPSAVRPPACGWASLDVAGGEGARVLPVAEPANPARLGAAALPLPTGAAPTQMRARLRRCRYSGDRGCPRALLPRLCKRAAGPSTTTPIRRRSGGWPGMRLARPRHKKHWRRYYVDRTKFGIKCRKRENISVQRLFVAIFSLSGRLPRRAVKTLWL